MTEERIIEQIRKLQNLADNAGTEHEAAAAVGRMQALLAKYNLNLADLPLAEDFVSPVGEERLDTKYLWRTTLLNVIAMYNFCKVLKQGNQAILIGQPHNREVVKFLYEVILRALMRLAKGQPRERRNHGMLSPRNSFIIGATQVLAERLRGEQREFVTKGSDKALVVVNTATARIKDYLKDKTIDKGRQRHQQVDREAYWAGQAAGRTIPLQQGVGSGHVATKSINAG